MKTWTRPLRSNRHLTSLLSLALGGVVVVCPPTDPLPTQPPPPPPVTRGLTLFATQAVRPVFDSSRRSTLYISGYAGRRPNPPVLTPTGLRRPLGGRLFGPRPPAID